MHKPNGFEIDNHVSDVLSISALGISQPWCVYYDRWHTFSIFTPSDNDTLDLFGLGFGFT